MSHMPPARVAPGRVSGPAVATVVVAVVVGALVPILVAHHYGALGIPRSDDWSYLVTQFRWTDGDGLSFNHWVTMTLVGQLVLSAPVTQVFPRDIAALQWFTAAMGAVGLGAAVLLVRRTGAPLGVALVGALAIALCPLWGPLAASYMTDVPAFACSTVALLLGVEALRRDERTSWLVAATVVGVLAFSIRQYAALPTVAVLLVAIADAHRAGRRAAARHAVVALAAFVLVALVISAWWSTVPAGKAVAPEIPDAHSLRVLAIKGAGFVRLAGLVLAPLLAWVGPVRIVRRAWRASPTTTVVLAGGAFVALASTAAVIRDDLFVGNYLVHDGVLSDIVMTGPRPDVLPGPVWALVVAFASAAGIVLVTAAVPFLAAVADRVRRRDLDDIDPVRAALVGTVIAYAAVYAVATACGIQMYDRYVLPLLPPLTALLGTTPGATARSRAWFAAGATLVLVGAVGLAFTVDSASFDGARWRAAERATRAGWRPTQVGGSFEWVDYHARTKVGLGDRRGHRRACVTVHIDPPVARGRVVAVATSSAPTRRTMRMVAYRTDAPCPTPTRP